MARKKLLTEGEIRQFMKLANLRPVNKVRLSEMGHHSYAGARDEDEELRDELGATEDELGDEDRVADEEGDELDAMGDMGDMGGDPEKEQMLADVVMAVADALGISDQVDVEGAPGDDAMEMDAEVEIGPGGDEEVAMALDVEDDDELPGGRDMYQESLVAEIVKRLKEAQGADDREDEHLGMVGGPESAHSQSEEDRRKEMRGARRAKGKKGDPVPTEESVDSQEAIVNEVAKRVAARLQTESRKEQMVDTLAERIMRRLTK